MNKGLFLKLDLQRFAEDELGAEDLELAEQGEESEEVEVTEEVEEEESAPEPEEEQDFKNEQNAAFANMRRKAEAEAKQKYDSVITDMCKGYVHPITGKPITTLEDYRDALYQQERLAKERELEENGIDPRMLDEIISNNPTIRQAQEIIQSSQRAEGERLLQEDFAKIKELDSSLKSISDIPNLEVISDYVNKGLSLFDAYRLVNFDSLVGNVKAGARQSAINQLKGKSHMTGIDSLSGSDDGEEVPAAELAMYKEIYPDKSVSDIRKLYNRTLGKLGGK